MKFLFVTTVKDTFTVLPATVNRQLMEATVAWMDDQKKRGKLLEAYMTPGGASAVICEHPSVEDAAQTIAACPMGGFLNFEVYALADYHVAMKAYIEACKQAEKLFPSAPR